MNLTQLALQSNIKLNEISNSESIKLKQTLLDMYQDIYKVCEKENIVCFLGGGTCLGAIRHKGFIPWDDDLDLMMFREDYNMLPELLEKEYPGKYNIKGPKLTEIVDRNFYKIEKKGTKLTTIFDLIEDNNGIAIDVFPIESISNKKINRYIEGILLNTLFYIALCVRLYKKQSLSDKVLMSTKSGKRKILFRKIIGFIFSFKSYSNWFNFGDSIASRKFKESSFVTIPSGRRHFFGEMQTIDTFYPPLKMTFENLPAFVPANYDKYLKAMFGNYMELPPVEKREKHFIQEISFGIEND